MDVSGVDNMLMNSYGMNDMGNIEVDKYQKGMYSPSPKSDDVLPVSQLQKVSSPQKSISPHAHVVPHYQHPLAPPQSSQQLPRMSPIPQPNFQQAHHHMQRKVQLGPNFDRLGILNQANEIPPMSAPYFAKALQQHGGNTLGAILQAHQHALQQQMQRESFLLQQAVHQQMFQNVPFNMYHQQRMNGMMMERRTDDQIVPNGHMIPPPESWLKHTSRPSPNKRMKIKHEEVELPERRNSNNYKPVHESNDKYVIFNDDTNVSHQTSEDEDSSPPIAPPKDSVFVRYPTNNAKTLPSFAEAFSGHIDKLKLKEQQMKDSLLRHGLAPEMLPESYPNQTQLIPDNPINQHLLPEALVAPEILSKPCPPTHVPADNCMTRDIQPEASIGEQLISVSNEIDQLLQDNVADQIRTVENIKTEPILADRITENNTMHSHDIGSQLKTSEEHRDEQTTTSEDKIIVPKTEINSGSEPHFEETGKNEAISQLEYLDEVSNLANKNMSENDFFSQCESEEKAPDKNYQRKNSDTDEKSEADTKAVADTDDNETENATNTIGIFQGDLNLDTDNPNYDNLFNGNTDEHYFQAFKENDLHLIGDLNDSKIDNGEDILKLLHSPLDFLNDKFLK